MNNLGRKEKRRYEVLSHIVSLYINRPAPVSSKSVVESMRDSVSSATVRNIMGELEDMGYISQPHTSAGRTPTDKGYRQYVNSIVESLSNKKREMQKLNHEYRQKIQSLKDLIESTSNIISTRLHHAGVVMWPGVEDLYLKRLELVKVEAEKVLAVLVSMSNTVKNYIIELDHDIERTHLAHVENYINQNYEDRSISEIYSELSGLGSHDETVNSANRILQVMLEKDIENDISWEGLNYFMSEPEFNDISITRDLFEFFTNKKDLSMFLRRELPESGIRVYIGEENEYDSLKPCSVVTSGYSLNGRTIGRIGVIGPRRMNYSDALNTISCLSELISRRLEEFYR